MICQQSITKRRPKSPRDLFIKLFVSLIVSLSCPPVFAQTLCPPYIHWQQSYGTDSDDLLTAAEERANGSFILGGQRWTNGYAFDYYVLRLDAVGQQLWSRNYGGSSFDHLRALRSTADGGFVLAGYSASADKGSPLFGHYDGWVVRADNNGDIVWQRAFGGTFFDGLLDVKLVGNGGYILGGYTLSLPGTGNKTSTAFGDYDFWVIRVDDQGGKLWEQSYGGSRGDYLHDVQPMPDGGFALVGTSRSGPDGNKSATNNGDYDLWVVRVDANGNKIWDRGFGGILYDEGREAVVTPDGGLLLAGTSFSPPSGNKESEHFGHSDYWVLRLDAAGNKLWERSFGGTAGDIVQGLRRTPDGSVIVAGESSSLPGPAKQSSLYGLSDYWMLRLNSAGALLWEQSLGGTGNDSPRVTHQTQDGAFFVAGSSASPPNGIKTAPHYGNNDFWLLKFLPQKPNDCDLDGVLNSRDLCPGSPRDSIVDSRGCTVTQSCPCSSGWRNNDDYVHCVRQVTAEMVRLGRMTDVEREMLLQQAMLTNCPPSAPPTNPPPDVPISFGFTNFALGNAVLTQGSPGEGVLAESGSGWYYGAAVYATGLGEDGTDGMAFLLGQAESGMFISPYAPVPWGHYDPANFMLGKTFGRVNGAENLLIGALQARKTDYEYYPVGVDLSPLAPTSLTFQVYQKNALRAERTVAGGSGHFVVTSSTTVDPRGNPFWRMPDGAVGALIELSTQANIILPDNSTALGDRIFVRANNPYDVAYVSRFEVYGGGGLPYFGVIDGRIGMFGLVHAIIGASVYGAFEGRLKITHLQTFDSHGFHVELNDASFYDLTLEPVALASDQTMQLFVLGQPVVQPSSSNSVVDPVSAIRLTHTRTHLEMSMDSWPTPSDTLVEVYKNATLAAQMLVQTNVLGQIDLKGNGDAPRVAGWSASAAGSNAVAITVSFDHFVRFVPAAGPPVRGNLIRITPNSALPALGLRTASFLTTTPSFTIRSETTRNVRPPLNIAATGTNVVLSWPLLNQPFGLESATALPGPFSPAPEQPVINDDGSSVSLPLDQTTTRFFRLRLENE